MIEEKYIHANDEREKENSMNAPLNRWMDGSTAAFIEEKRTEKTSENTHIYIQTTRAVDFKSQKNTTYI